MKNACQTRVNIRVDDLGDHYQVYQEEFENGKKFVEIKLGNIYGQEGLWVSEHYLYEKQTWSNFERALAYLISPRGMT